MNTYWTAKSTDGSRKYLQFAFTLEFSQHRPFADSEQYKKVVKEMSACVPR